MKKGLLIPGIIVAVVGVVALIGGAGATSLIFIIPGIVLIVLAFITKKKEIVPKATASNCEQLSNSQIQIRTTPNVVSYPKENDPATQDSTYSVQQHEDKTCNSDITEKTTVRRSILSTPASSVYIDSLKEKFFAVDVETTGLSPERNRIIELSAVKFEKGAAVDSFSTLVASVKHVPEAASSVNGITDEDLEIFGEDEVTAFCQFADFVGKDALTGKVCLVAHNATFDMAFIVNTLKRLRFNEDATLRYFDTLALSRKYLSLSNYKQNTVASYFGIINCDEHRAESDAKTCGEILVRLLDNMEDEAEQARIIYERTQPSDEEREICAYIKKMLAEAGRDTTRLRFEKRTGGIVAAKYPYGFASFKILKNKPMYFIFSKNDYVECGLEGIDNEFKNDEASSVRVNITNPHGIDFLKDTFVKGHKRDGKRITEFYHQEKWVLHDTEQSFQIEDSEVEPLVAKCIMKAEEREKQKAIAEAEKTAIEKEKEERRIARKQRAEEQKNSPKAEPKSRQRIIRRYNDEMILLEEYDSVTHAAEAVGISPKSIRDAASGKQKHAAGYVWRFVDDNEVNDTGEDQENV